MENDTCEKGKRKGKENATYKEKQKLKQPTNDMEKLWIRKKQNKKKGRNEKQRRESLH